MIKLNDYNKNIDGLLRETNPFAIITAAHLKTKATKGDTQTRYSWRWKITTALYEGGFSKQDILNIYRLIDWLMMLPEDLTKRFTEDLIKYEEEKKMPYIMSAERIGKEKGMQQGIQQGIQQGMQQGMLTDAREMVLEALDARFSKDVPEDVYKKVQALNNRVLLKKLLRSAAQSEDIDSFKKVLQEIPSGQPEE
jgi:flagellar biosynthesis/type III secretory pathway protein FliH